MGARGAAQLESRYSHDPDRFPVPADLLWGASTAAHQIEGQDVSSDWWRLEHRPDSFVAEPSSDAADSWREDMDILAGP